MNLVLLEPDDFQGADRVVLRGRRLEHVREICRAAVGDELRVGRVDGPLGSGRVVALDADRLELRVVLDEPPPPPLDVTLAVALPRPPTLRKVLQQATALGVKRFALFGSRRVEKSYWQSRGLEPAALRHQLCLGLEQARDTALPRVECHRRFAAFVREALPALAAGRTLWLGDADAPGPEPVLAGAPGLLVIGPEGGFLPHERDSLLAAGAQPLRVGGRPLRVETAVVACLARLAL